MEKTDFENIYNHVIPIEDFRMKWRFMDSKYDILPAEHLAQLKPLDNKASGFLWDFILDSQLHNDIPFTKDFFQVIDKASINDNNESEIRKWLYHRGLPFSKDVFLSWQPEDAMIVPWKIFIKYFDSFYYSISDDLTVFDESLQWALMFYHENEIYFGTNKKFVPSTNFNEVEFLWDN
ncbi:MAG: hypothetical protein EOO46_23935 [Flavobacterium sp.]|nr:MAG: hypothetical protein EOO46_23935 [Flavobacterium sp.]